MSLRVQAEQDLAATLEASGDFGWGFTLTDPQGFTNEGVNPLFGQSGDIGTVIDPNTGMAVSGRLAHLAMRIESLRCAGFTGLPEGIADPSSKPWLVAFEDLSLAAHAFKVRASMPDRTLGIVTVTLSFYEAV